MVNRTKHPQNSRKDNPISRSMIENCAIRLFKMRGVEGTSINEIVKSAGIAKGTFYLYFKDKDELVNSVISSYAMDFLTQVIMPNSDVTRLVTLSSAIISYFRANPVFLVELRRNLLSEYLYPSTRTTVTAFSQLVIKNLNQYESYPIHNWEIYTRVMLGMILDVCYKAIIEEELGDDADIMLSDFLKRFFSCE